MEEVPDPEETELLNDLRLGFAPGTILLGDLVGRVGRPIMGFFFRNLELKHTSSIMNKGKLFSLKFKNQISGHKEGNFGKIPMQRLFCLRFKKSQLPKVGIHNKKCIRGVIHIFEKQIS